MARVNQYQYCLDACYCQFCIYRVTVYHYTVVYTTYANFYIMASTLLQLNSGNSYLTGSLCKNLCNQLLLGAVYMNSIGGGSLAVLVRLMIGPLTLVF